MADITPRTTTISYMKYKGQTSESKGANTIRFKVNTNNLNVGPTNSVAVDECNFEILESTIQNGVEALLKESLIFELDSFTNEDPVAYEDAIPPYEFRQAGDGRWDVDPNEPAKKKRRHRDRCPCLPIQDKPKARLVCPHGHRKNTRGHEEIQVVNSRHYVVVYFTADELSEIKELLWKNDYPANPNYTILQPEGLIHGAALAYEFLSRNYNWQRFMDSLIFSDGSNDFLLAWADSLALGVKQNFTPIFDENQKLPYSIQLYDDAGGKKYARFEMNNTQMGFRFMTPAGADYAPPRTALQALIPENDFNPDSYAPKVYDPNAWTTPYYQCRFIPLWTDVAVDYLFNGFIGNNQSVGGVNESDLNNTTAPITNNTFIPIKSWIEGGSFPGSYRCFFSQNEVYQLAWPWIWGGSFLQNSQSISYGLEPSVIEAAAAARSNGRSVPSVSFNYKILQLRLTDPLIRGVYTNSKVSAEKNDLPAPIEIFLDEVSESGGNEVIRIMYNPDKIVWNALGNTRLKTDQNFEYSIKMITDRGQVHDVDINDERNLMYIRLLLSMQ